MIEDKQRWNERHVTRPMSKDANKTLVKYIEHANIGQALDVACGTGRNSHYLSQLGFDIDAVDISDFALTQMDNTPTIKKVEADLDTYNITPNKYDLIINMNYLNRRLASQMKDGLKQGGLIIFETFIVAHGEFQMPTTNLDYLLRKNELLHMFIGLDVIYYEEKIEVNRLGERVNIASTVA